MELSFPSLEEEVKQFYFQNFANQEEFKLESIQDLINQFSGLQIEESKEEQKNIVFPFGEKTKKRDLKAEKKSVHRSDISKQVSQEGNDSQAKLRQLV